MIQYLVEMAFRVDADTPRKAVEQLRDAPYLHIACGLVIAEGECLGVPFDMPPLILGVLDGGTVILSPATIATLKECGLRLERIDGNEAP